MASLINSSFGCAANTGLTVSKLIEAVRRLKGTAKMLEVGPQQHADLCNQLETPYAGDPCWEEGHITKFMGIPVKVWNHWQGRGAVCHGECDTVQIDCFEVFN